MQSFYIYSLRKGLVRLGRGPLDSHCICYIFLSQIALPVYQLNYHSDKVQNGFCIMVKTPDPSGRQKESLSHSRFKTTVNEILLLPRPQSSPLGPCSVGLIPSSHEPLVFPPFPILYNLLIWKDWVLFTVKILKHFWDVAEIILYYLQVLFILDYFLHLSETTRISIHVGVF